MAYIPGYTYDIFISYAHLDNLKMPGQALGWIELFYQSLNLKLAQRLGRMDAVKIWWDRKKLDGSKLFDHSIEEGIKNSALFIGLISPGYLHSEYCRREVELFHTKSSAETVGGSLNDHSRMIKVLLNNIPHQQLPEHFGRATGFPFYKSEDEEDYGEPLDSTDPVFARQLKDLRDSIVRIFEAFPKEQGSFSTLYKPETTTPTLLNTVSNSIEENPLKNNFSVFFGEVPISLKAARKRTISELEKNGFTIVTDIPPPDDALAHEQKIREVLPNIDLAVHLLDQLPGREIADTDTWYTKKQAELSLQLSPSKLLWVPSDFDHNDIEEENYKSFLQKIELNNDPENTFEFIRGTKSELAKQIIDYADTIKQSRVRKESTSKIAVLLDTHFSDQQYAFTLGQALLKSNMQPFINPQEDDPRKNINMLADRISQVNKLVFLYGQVTREWVLERINAALQLIITHNYPIDDFYIYLAPPNKMDGDIKLNQRFLKINVVNNSANPDLSADLLNAFINDLKGGNAA